MSAAAVFLDRDGVLNEALVRDGDARIRRESADDVGCCRACEAACEALRDAGLRADLRHEPARHRARHADPAEVEAINDRLRAALPLDEVVVCPHDDADDCACRKPRPGMILDAAARWDLDLDAQLHGRRPLARRRGGPRRRDPHRVHRPRLR